jgi:uncharacterized protein YdiU (UPF0061 family)
MRLGLEHSYATDLPGFHVPGVPDAAPAPQLLFRNRELSIDLGLDLEGIPDDALARILSGTELPEDARPIAQAYAGHQFGRFSPQLGDGRALLMGEVVDSNGRRFDLAFKGSGRTVFSRGGDGKAAVGPMLREVLVSEALHALGIPTTRCLAVAATGEPVRRETVLPGAVLTRVAASHIRIGTFEHFAARGDLERVRLLADYAIARHDPDLVGREDRFLAFLHAVTMRQARLLAQWMNVGFVHGVMNTDNMTVSGESIDFGPCAFLEGYDPAAVFSSIDHAGRYAFGNQPAIAQWNLARLCGTFLPLLSDDERASVEMATGVIVAFPGLHAGFLLEGQRAKLGIAKATPQDDEPDGRLARDWLALLHERRADFTLAWRHLADAMEGDREPLAKLLPGRQGLEEWLDRWERRAIRTGNGPDATAGRNADPTAMRLALAEAMRRASPAVIPRNHLVEAALEAASAHGDLSLFEELLEGVRRPFRSRPAGDPLSRPAPAGFTESYRTFCGT